MTAKTATNQNFHTKADGKFGKRIRDLRKQNNLYQKALLDSLKDIGCMHGDVGAWEAGRSLPRYETVNHLARVFKLMPGDLVKDTEIEREYNILYRIEKCRTDPEATNTLDLLDALIEYGAYDDPHAWRLPQTKNYLDKFAALNGFSGPATCPISIFKQPLTVIYKQIESDVKGASSIHDLRNYKNNIGYFKRESEIRGFLDSQGPLYGDDELFPWKDIPHVKGIMDFKGTKLSLEELEQNPKFKGQLEHFIKYSMNPRCPSPIRKRRITASDRARLLSRIAGIHVRHLGANLKDISFEFLVRPENVNKFVDFQIAKTKEQQILKYPHMNPDDITGVTRTIFGYIAQLRVVARYFLEDLETYRIINDKILMTLPKPQILKNKEKRMVSIAVLEKIGKSLYPFNAKRLAQCKFVRQALRDLSLYFNDLSQNLQGTLVYEPSKRCKVKGTTWGLRVCISTMIRMLLRAPVRERNIVEMRLGKNLYKKDGKYILEFEGPELKIEHRNDETNRVVHVFEPDGTGFYELLDEWLTLWRPYLILTAQLKKQGKGGKEWVQRVMARIRSTKARCSISNELPEIVEPGEDHKYVFVNREGLPVSKNFIYQRISGYTYRYSGKKINPHLIRDIFATDYLRDTREKYGHCDLVGAAWMLNNSIRMIERHYAHILNESAGIRARQWISQKLTEGIPEAA